MLERSATMVSRLVYDSVSMVEKLYFYTHDATETDKKMIESNYKDRLRDLEVSTQKSIEEVWNHGHLQKEQKTLTFEEMDLFSEETASVFGLTRKELIITGATSGAVTGAGIDLLFAGHTLLLGGTIGALIGGTGAYFGFNELSEVKVLGQSMGKRYLEMGPMENRNFPYILLGRAIYHTMKVAQISHAKREVFDIEMDQGFKEKWLDNNIRGSLEKYHKKFRSGSALESDELKEYESIIKSILKHLIDA
jgi:hypothetical protein